MCKLVLGKKQVLRGPQVWGPGEGRQEEKEVSFVGFTCDQMSLWSVLRSPSPSAAKALPSAVGAALQCNRPWQAHTWQQSEWWRGSFEHRGVVLQRGDGTRAGGCDSPPACDWWYGSVSEPICHICPCHFASVRGCCGHTRSSLKATVALWPEWRRHWFPVWKEKRRKAEIEISKPQIKW